MIDEYQWKLSFLARLTTQAGMMAVKEAGKVDKGVMMGCC